MSVVTDLIAQIQADLDELRIAYIQFLSDHAKEPHQLRKALEMRVRKLKSFMNLRTEEEFRTRNTLAKVSTMTSLWDKQVDRKYEGKPRPPKPADTEEKEATVVTKEKPEKKPVSIGNAEQEREKVVSLYDEYMRLNLLLGSRKMINFGKFQAFIHSQTQKIQRAKNVTQVQYEVSVKDQQVVIKSKSLK